MATPATRTASLQRVWDEEDVIARHWWLATQQAPEAGGKDAAAPRRPDQRLEGLSIHLRERPGRTSRVAQALAVCAASVPQLRELALTVLPQSDPPSASSHRASAGGDRKAVPWDVRGDVARCRWLRHLTIHGGALLRSDESSGGLAFIAALSETLETLDLTGASGFTSIATLTSATASTWPNFHRLVLNGTQVDGKGLQPIGALTVLATLHLANCKRLTSLEAMGGAAARVQHLVLSGSPMTGDGLMSLGAGCPRLETLDVSRCLQLTHLRGVASLQYLRVINASGTRLTSDSLAVLGDELARSLQALDLTDCTTVDSIVPLVGARSNVALTSLNLSGTPVTNAGLRSLKQLNQLQELRLYRCHSVSDTAPIAACRRLHTLLMGGCTALTTAGAAPLVHNPNGGMPRLAHLDLSGCAKVDAAMLTQVVEACPLLREVVLKGTQADDRTVRALAGREALQSLDLTHCRNVTSVLSCGECSSVENGGAPSASAPEEGKRPVLSKGWVSLRALILCGTSLTLDGVHELEAVETLDTLDVSMCPSVADWDAADAMRARLTSFRIGHT